MIWAAITLFVFAQALVTAGIPILTPIAYFFTNIYVNILLIGIRRQG